MKDIVKLRLDLGYHTVIDGEYSRHSMYPGGPKVCTGWAADSRWTVLWGSFCPGLQGMKEVEHPDPDILGMCIPDMAAFTGKDRSLGETVTCTGRLSMWVAPIQASSTPSSR